MKKLIQNYVEPLYIIDLTDFYAIEGSLYRNSPLIRQKGESQNGCFKETNHAKFSKKRTFITP